MEQLETRSGRRKRKAVVVRLTNFDDRFVEGITSIFNETPIRQGRTFLALWKRFRNGEAPVQSILVSRRNFRCISGRRAGRIHHVGERRTICGPWSNYFKDRAVVTWRLRTLLLAKAVERCAEKGIPVPCRMPIGSMTVLVTSNEAMVFKNLICPDISCP